MARAKGLGAGRAHTWRTLSAHSRAEKNSSGVRGLAMLSAQANVSLPPSPIHPLLAPSMPSALLLGSPSHPFVPFVPPVVPLVVGETQWDGPLPPAMPRQLLISPPSLPGFTTAFPTSVTVPSLSMPAPHHPPVMPGARVHHMYTAEVVLAIAGSISDYGDAEIRDVATAIGRVAAVQTSEVQVAIVSGSVQISALISTPSYSMHMAIASNLTVAFASASVATSLLNLTVLHQPTVRFSSAAVVVPAPSEPPLMPLSPHPSPVHGSEGTQVAVISVIIGACAFTALLVWLQRRAQCCTWSGKNPTVDMPSHVEHSGTTAPRTSANSSAIEPCGLHGAGNADVATALGESSTTSGKGDCTEAGGSGSDNPGGGSGDGGGGGSNLDAASSDDGHLHRSRSVTWADQQLADLGDPIQRLKLLSTQSVPQVPELTGPRKALRRLTEEQKDEYGITEEWADLPALDEFGDEDEGEADDEGELSLSSMLAMESSSMTSILAANTAANERITFSEQPCGLSASSAACSQTACFHGAGPISTAALTQASRAGFQASSTGCASVELDNAPKSQMPPIVHGEVAALQVKPPKSRFRLPVRRSATAPPVATSPDRSSEDTLQVV